MRGITYQRLKDWCDANGKSVSGFVEELIAERLDELGVPAPTVLRVRAPANDKTPDRGVDDIISQHFTF